VAIAAGPFSDAIEVDAALLAANGIAGCSAEAPVDAHFRSEDARLCPPNEAIDGVLVLRGEIVQCSYPGGFYRYAVRVGRQQYLVDDPRRIAVGEAIGIALPAAVLHLYAATQSENTQ
jgi:ABC-type Fe3+/spermidine/putrescine transport system ATPase subunit